MGKQQKHGYIGKGSCSFDKCKDMSTYGKMFCEKHACPEDMCKNSKEEKNSYCSTHRCNGCESGT